MGRQEEALELLRKKRILVTSLRPKQSSVALPKFGGSGVQADVVNGNVYSGGNVRISG